MPLQGDIAKSLWRFFCHGFPYDWVENTTFPGASRGLGGFSPQCCRPHMNNTGWFDRRRKRLPLISGRSCPASLVFCFREDGLWPYSLGQPDTVDQIQFPRQVLINRCHMPPVHVHGKPLESTSPATHPCGTGTLATGEFDKASVSSALPSSDKQTQRGQSSKRKILFPADTLKGGRRGYHCRRENGCYPLPWSHFSGFGGPPVSPSSHW